LHQSYQYSPDPMLTCYESGHYFKKIYSFKSVTNFFCVKCGFSTSFSESCFEDIDWGLKELGVNLYE
jgi:hypothetical protein